MISIGFAAIQTLCKNTSQTIFFFGQYSYVRSYYSWENWKSVQLLSPPVPATVVDGSCLLVSKAQRQTQCQTKWLNLLLNTITLTVKLLLAERPFHLRCKSHDLIFKWKDEVKSLDLDQFVRHCCYLSLEWICQNLKTHLHDSWKRCLGRVGAV